MNKKYIIIGALVAIVAFFTMCGKAEAQEVKQEKTWSVNTEVGYYESRISGGLVGAEDAPYVKASTKIGDFYGLSLVGGIEYVQDLDARELHGSIGTVLDTPVGDIDTRVIAHNKKGSDTTFELVGAYGVNLLSFVDTELSLSVENGANGVADTIDPVYTPAIVISKTFNTGTFDLIVGGEYGQTLGFDEDYEYIHGFARLETIVNDTAKLFVQGNWINSDVVFADGITYADTQLNWGQSVNAGLAFSF